MQKLLRIILKITKWFLLSAGIFFIILCVVAFTTLPYHLYHRLATYSLPDKFPPKAIVMLSGAGIPSENGLIRAYYTAKLAAKFPDARVVVVAPGDTSNKESDPVKIANELTIRGVSADRIIFEPNGKNTRGQALNLASGSFKDLINSYIIIVSSPEHITRAVKTFNRAGFTWVSGMPTFETSLSENLEFDDNTLEGNKMVPPIGGNLQFRYQFWNHLKYEILVIREYFALAFYKLRGWI
ncbi:MAG: YdcF family protein [Lentimicrobium sp.]|nr:YdcF family protein [Lentimicrobium sp.]